MKWFRKGQPRARRAPVRPSARPTVEALEDRNLLNASVAFDAAGNMAEVVVFNEGNGHTIAFEYTSAGASVIGMDVRVAHVFRDAAGKIGLDIVYLNGAAFQFSSAGATQIGNNNVLDVSTAYDAKGNVQTDVLFQNGTPLLFPTGLGVPGLYEPGNLFEYTNTGATLLSTNAIFATAYVDTNGRLGRAVGILNNPNFPFNILSFTQDSTGTKTLYNGPAGNDAITDYDQSSPANNSVPANVSAQTISDVTYVRDGCTQYGPGSTVQGIGNGNVAPF